MSVRMFTSKRSARPVQQKNILQVKCLTSDEGHLWIDSFDHMPAIVRDRLRNSPFNLCAACLETFVLPEVVRKYPRLTRDHQLLIAVKVMEAQVRKEGVV